MPVHRIAAGETNCYLLQGSGGTILIDAGPNGAADGIITGILAAGISPQAVKLILVTHGHLDHYGAAQKVKDWCGAPIAAHPQEAVFSQDKRNALPPAQTLRGSVTRRIFFLVSSLVPLRPLEPDVLLEAGMDLSPYGADAETLLLPGHSPASLGVLTPDADCFVGDLLVNYVAPSQPIYLWDKEAWQQSVQRLRRLKPGVVYVGHGEPFLGAKLEKIYPPRYQFRWWVR
jgi:glyoxylase-like metal-dependent hydrolase (beta-lactamase superfamily II)